MLKEDNFEKKFILNARALAKDLDVELIEKDLIEKSKELLQTLEKVEKNKIFNAESLLDLGKVKCSYRTTILSCYQAMGYIIAGCTNKTEYELGFFLTFGDNIANFKPIEHLYKHEVIKLSYILGTKEEVILAPPSAGFWEFQEDLEDIAYWIINKGPILKSRTFNEQEIRKANKIKNQLRWEKIDKCLQCIAEKKESKEISKEVKLPLNIINDLKEVTRKSKKYKRREILVSIKPVTSI